VDYRCPDIQFGVLSQREHSLSYPKFNIAPRMTFSLDSHYVRCFSEPQWAPETMGQGIGPNFTKGRFNGVFRRR
jgi:hypothetical protein